MPRPHLLPALLLSLGCSDTTPPQPPCDAACEDGIALRALRETLKLVYNLTLQGNPVGEQDESTPCTLAGSARVFGAASAEPEHGATIVDLTYELRGCRHIELDEEADETYEMSIDGTLTQSGIIAAQPSATTALLMRSGSLTLEGTVHDPPRPYSAEDCVIELGQNGSRIAGTLCGRDVGTNLGGPPF